jgi:3'(2'), 5'-bisphosphate nucleotidase
MQPISVELESQIRHVIRQCGQQAEQMALGPFEVIEKGPEDYVTNIDALLDRQLSITFATLFPRDGVITEEDSQSRQNFDDGHSRLWCIDPLDGTEDFIWRRGNYAVMVGLLENYHPLAGWIYAPAQDRMYFGGTGWGLFQADGDQAPIPLSVIEPPDPEAGVCPILIGHRDQKRFGEAIAQQIPAAHFYSIGSFGLKVLEVITGRAGLYIYLNQRVKLWDTTGPLAMAHRAGLTCCSLEGEPIQFCPNSVVRETLAHRQSLIIGWPNYVEILRPKLEAAIQATQQNS